MAPTPVFLPGESQGRGNLVGCRLWGHTRVGHDWSDLAQSIEKRKVASFIWDDWFSVQFSRSVVSDSLRPHESQHARPPCPSPTPRVYSDSCPSSRWCHPAVSSSVVPFSSCPQWLVLVKSREDFPHYQIFPKMVSNDSFFFLLHLKQTFLCMF